MKKYSANYSHNRSKHLIEIIYTNNNYIYIILDNKYSYNCYATHGIYNTLCVCLDAALDNKLISTLFSDLVVTLEKEIIYNANLLQLNIQALDSNKSYDAIKRHACKKAWSMLKNAGGYGNVSSINASDKVLKMIGKEVSDLPDLSYLCNEDKFYSWYYANC